MRVAALTMAIALLVTGTATADGDEASRPRDLVLVVETGGPDPDLALTFARAVVDLARDVHRLAAVEAGPDPRVWLPLEQVSTVEGKERVKQALGQMRLDLEGPDLAAALGTAITALEQDGRAEAERVVLLLARSDRSGTGPEGLPAATYERLKRDVLPGYIAAGVTLQVFAVDGPVPALQAAANITGGRCLIVGDVSSATDALELVLERPPRERCPRALEAGGTAEPVVCANPPVPVVARGRDGADRFLPWIVALGALGLAALAWLTRGRIAGRGRRGVGGPTAGEEDEAEGDAPGGFAELRETSTKLGNAIVDAGELVEALSLDLEDYGVARWKREQDLEERHRDLIRELFLILDHLELGSGGPSGDGAEHFFEQKLRRLLKAVGVEEIPVTRGDEFDGLVHKHVAERPDELKAGAVIDVQRVGYRLAGGGGDEAAVLRQAEVVVSSGAGGAGGGERGR